MVFCDSSNQNRQRAGRTVAVDMIPGEAKKPITGGKVTSLKEVEAGDSLVLFILLSKPTFYPESSSHDLLWLHQILLRLACRVLLSNAGEVRVHKAPPTASNGECPCAGTKIGDTQ